MGLPGPLVAVIVVVILVFVAFYALIFLWLRKYVKPAWEDALDKKVADGSSSSSSSESSPAAGSPTTTDAAKDSLAAMPSAPNTASVAGGTAGPSSVLPITAPGPSSIAFGGAAQAALPQTAFGGAGAGSPSSPVPEIEDGKGTWDARPYRRRMFGMLVVAAVFFLVGCSCNLGGIYKTVTYSTCNEGKLDPTPNPGYIAICESGVGVSLSSLETFAWLQFFTALCFYAYYLPVFFMQISDPNWGVSSPLLQAGRNTCRLFKFIGLLLLSATFSGANPFDVNDDCSAFKYQCRMPQLAALRQAMGVALLFLILEVGILVTVAGMSHWDLSFAKELRRNGDPRGATPLGTFRPISWRRVEEEEEQQRQRLLGATSSSSASPAAAGEGNDMGCCQKAMLCLTVWGHKLRDALQNLRIRIMEWTRSGWTSFVIIVLVFSFNFLDLTIMMNASVEFIRPIARTRTMAKPSSQSNLFPFIEADWNVRSCSRLFDAAEQQWPDAYNGSASSVDNATIVVSYETQGETSAFEYLYLCSNLSSSRPIIAGLPGASVGVKTALPQQFRVCNIAQLQAGCSPTAQVPNCTSAYETKPTPYGVLWSYDIDAPLQLSSCQNTLAPSGLPACNGIWLYVWADVFAAPSMRDFGSTVAWWNIIFLCTVNLVAVVAIAVLLITEKFCPMDMTRFVDESRASSPSSSPSSAALSTPAGSPISPEALANQPVLKRWLVALVREYPMLVQVFLGESLVGRSLWQYYEWETEVAIAAELEASPWRSAAELEYEARATLLSIGLKAGALINVTLPAFFCPRGAAVIYIIMKLSQILFHLANYILIERKTRLMQRDTKLMHSTPKFLSASTDYLPVDGKN